MMSDELLEALEKIFAADSELYQQRGFQRRIGFGKRPALINIDLANAWTRPGNPFSCLNMDVIIPATAYDAPAGLHSDMGLWHKKIPTEILQAGSELCAIDDRVAPMADELVIEKKRASGFHGTYLAGFLRAHGVDTVIITGVTMAGCVRHTTEDAIAEGFRPIVVREAVGDRVPGATEWNLFDIDAKFGDVEPLDTVLKYLEGCAAG